jgi:hypothetical protein
MRFENTFENQQKMDRVAEYLRGTCKSLEEGLATEFGEDGTDILEFDTELLRRLDDQILECQGCNWWCETGEVNDDTLCTDCAPEDSED